MSLELDQAASSSSPAEEVKTSLPRDAGDLLALAGSVDRQVAGEQPGQPGQAAPALSLEREIAGMFAMIGAGLGNFLPSVKTVLDDNAATQLGDVLAPVARKYGIARFIAGFAWRLELQALMVAVPIGFGVAAAIKHDLAELAKRQAEAEGRAPASGAAATVGTGEAGSSAPPSQPGMLQPIERPAP